VGVAVVVVGAVVLGVGVVITAGAVADVGAGVAFAGAAVDGAVVDGAALEVAALDVAALDLAALDVAAPDGTAAADPDARWRAEFAITAWLLGVDGTVGVRGEAARAHATFLDIIEATDSLFAFSGRVEVGRGRFTLFLDGMYSEAADENATGPLGIADVDITFKQTLLDFGAMYRLTPASGSADAVAIDAYAGGRYTWVSLEIEPAHRPRAAGDRGWTDPIVGARIAVPLGDGFRLAVNGDIGGFGAASDFTWSATALVAYDFAVRDTPASVMLGYRAVGWEHARGEGSGRFTWDVIQHGAMLGFALRF